MALINCSECGREISSEATNCPGCGYPVDYENKQIVKAKRIKLFKVLSIIFGGLTLLSLIFLIISASWFLEHGDKFSYEKAKDHTSTTAAYILGTSHYQEIDYELIKDGKNMKKKLNTSSITTAIFFVSFLIFVILYQKQKPVNKTGLKQTNYDISF